ncbi:uncharacterized protein VNE69_01191 [Vairimorpha necatrix]|uniref:Uncharacterized protein n=1 Tax=Vairimorpha necatrix TaxID=6039 RepID=A0AAX4J8Q4_9MICR
MKKKWIYDFHKILINHKDMSDYERFFISYKKYIKENKNEHFEISKVLISALYKFKKVFLLSMTYRLIFSLEVDIKIDTEFLIKHFRCKKLRSCLFPVFKMINYELPEKKIVKMLYDVKYEDINFFKYISNKKSLLENFLVLEDEKYIRKQLLVILHTKYYFNMNYYIKFLGDTNKHMGFLVYEILTFMILTNNDNMNILNDNINIVNKDQVYIKLNNKIEIKSIDNFLIYFLCFMKNKQEIYEMIKNNKIENIEKILKNEYLITDSKLGNIKNIKLYSTDIKNNVNNFKNLIFEEIDEDYEFLFSGSNYKNISDCVEF